MSQADFAVIGLAVMGENLALNIESRGYQVAVFNRTTEKVTTFIEGRAKNRNFVGAYSLEELCQQLSSPKKVMLMVKAGAPVDATIEKLLPFLEDGDIIIDGGNSNFEDSQRRFEFLKSQKISFVGCGVSGGELGALRGPALMPGGDIDAWEIVRPIFEKASARAGDNEPCCAWIGHGGAGHFVKMVHNGIEYGDMQIICEAYQLIKDCCRFGNGIIGTIFEEWNKGDLSSYLIEITAEIVKYKDDDGRFLLDLILDTAGQKGTGKWTGITALNEGIPLSLIADSVFARCISAQKETRFKASTIYTSPQNLKSSLNVSDIGKAIFAAKLISYSQGVELISASSALNRWEIDNARVAEIWRGGCIIRSTFLDEIALAFRSEENLPSLMFSIYYKKKLKETIPALRLVVAEAVKYGIPVPALSAAISYFDSLRTRRLPANLLQAQRDYFGAHTYERVDAPRGEFYHTNWTGDGGDTVSTGYNL
jgi:6-phosphogluconate dehydrogenase